MGSNQLNNTELAQLYTISVAALILFIRHLPGSHLFLVAQYGQYLAASLINSLTQEHQAPTKTLLKVQQIINCVYQLQLIAFGATSVTR